MRSLARQLNRAPVLLVATTLVVITASLSGRLLGVAATVAPPFIPDDVGRIGERGGWMQLQWNFVGPYGVDAPRAWANLVAAGGPGGRGVTVAVLDTGVAYGVRIMPVRVLDRAGNGDAVTIARGIRFAAQHEAKVINLSFNFDTSVTTREIPELLDALEFAHERGTLVVAGAGNVASGAATYPARGPHVLAVGATTEHGCLASYSNYGTGVDLVAPGGGNDADIDGDPHCRAGRPGSSVYQVSLVGRDLDRFDITGYTGTSMAAPHVAAAVALVVASGVLGNDPSPDAIEDRLEQTTRDLGRPGYDQLYGWGLVDVAYATAPGPARRPASN